MTMLDSMPEISTLEEGGRKTSKPIVYGGKYSWEKPSSIEDMTNRERLFDFAKHFYGTKDMTKWRKASPEQKQNLAKMFSAMQGNSHYSSGAVYQQINYAYQALKGKVTGSIDMTLKNHATAVKLGLYISK